MRIILRLMTNADLHNDTAFADLGIVCTGTIEECREFARLNDYEFLQSTNVFGGYFKNANGDCLLPDVPPIRIHPIGSPRKPQEARPPETRLQPRTGQGSP